MKRYRNLLIAAGSGLLLWVSWPVSPLTYFIFIAWVPLLWLEARISSRRKFFGLTYVTMLTWNLGATWWIWNASVPGAIAAFLANSLLMCFPWLGFKIVKKWMGERTGYLSLIVFWMCFEYIHLQDWGLSWPWLTLGNAFATHTQWIQWYQYTGASGGTLWILLLNIFLFLHLYKNWNIGPLKTYKYLFPAAIFLIIPILISKIVTPGQPGPGTGPNVVVVQPNIDPYEKISTGSFEAQLKKLIHLSEQVIDTNTALLVWPETALYMENGIDEERLKENFFLNPLWDFLKRHPNLDLFTGIESFRSYTTPATKTAKPAGEGFYFDSYNGSALLDSAGAIGFYHKSMLVPGVETLPWFLKFIDSWFAKFGGTTAGYAKQKERIVLAAQQGYRIAPAICYESIYGGFMRKYIHNGANLICIITNDGWWKNTPGHKQHMNYARLRAIETRTWIARSANTGISCFINPAGTIIDAQPWDKPASIKYPVPIITNGRPSFFVKHGDLLSIGSLFVSLGLIAWLTWLWISRKFPGKKKR